MRNDPPGMTPLRKLIAPPERTVQIVSVISNHEDAVGAVLSLGLRSFSFSLPRVFLSRIRNRSPLSLSFSLQEYACRSVPPNLFARKIFLRVVSQKRILMRDPPHRITCNGAIFVLAISIADFLLTRLTRTRSYSSKLILNRLAGNKILLNERLVSNILIIKIH